MSVDRQCPSAPPWRDLWTRWCSSTSLWLGKHSPQCEHWYNFSSVWMYWCVSRVYIFLKLFPRWIRLSPVWVHWYVLRSLWCVKPFLHCEHWYSLSPVWMHWWVWILNFSVKLAEVQLLSCVKMLVCLESPISSKTLSTIFYTLIDMLWNMDVF